MSVYALKDTDWSRDDADEGRPVIVIADTPEDAVRIATEKHIRDCPGSGGVTWDIARLNLVAFGDAEWGSDNTPNFEPLTYYDEGVNGLPDTPPDASAAKDALDIDYLLQPLDDIYVRDGFCDWADVANARDEIRAALAGAKP